MQTLINRETMSCSGICVLAPSPWLLPDTTTMLLASGGCCISMSSVDSVNPLYVLCVCMQTCMIVCQLGDYIYIYHLPPIISGNQKQPLICVYVKNEYKDDMTLI